jgi:pyridoxal phosphate enzyme (YggS family)
MPVTAVDQGLVDRIAFNLGRVRDRVQRAAADAGCDPQAVQILGVTKTFGVDVMHAGVAAGLRILGENRVQEAKEKIPLISGDCDVVWHFIGHLQSNKVRVALDLFDVIQSVDSRRLARRIDEAARHRGQIVPVLIEVNTSREPSKQGFTPTELDDAVNEIGRFENLDLRGLMTVGPLAADQSQIRASFQLLRRLREDLKRNHPSCSWDTLSMGMSNDYEIAVQEGATLIRLGQALFGAREKPAAGG